MSSWTELKKSEREAPDEALAAEWSPEIEEALAETDLLAEALREAPSVEVSFDQVLSSIERVPSRPRWRTWVFGGLVMAASALLAVLVLPDSPSERDRGAGATAPAFEVEVAAERDGAVRALDGSTALQEGERAILRVHTAVPGALRIVDAGSGQQVHPASGVWTVGAGSHSPAVDGTVLGYTPDGGARSATLEVEFCTDPDGAPRCATKTIGLEWVRP